LDFLFLSAAIDNALVIPPHFSGVSLDGLAQLDADVMLSTDRELLLKVYKEVAEVKKQLGSILSTFQELNTAMSQTCTSALEYHERNTNVFASKLPCTSVEDLIDVNTVLKDEKIAVSLV
jgi:hypothetical protein